MNVNCQHSFAYKWWSGNNGERNMNESNNFHELCSIYLLCACVFTSAMHPHSRCGNHSDWCARLSKLFEAFVSIRVHKREMEREAVCHLCSLLWRCDAAGCCEIDSNVQTNNEEKEQPTETWKIFLLPSATKHLQRVHRPGCPGSETLFDWDLVVCNTRLCEPENTFYHYWVYSSCVHGYVTKQFHTSAQDFTWGQIENNPN